MVAVPRVTPEQAEEIALRHYGMNASAERLASEHDDAFRLTTRAGQSRLLKISVADDAGDPVSFQTAILLHLAGSAPQLPVQRVTAALDGAPEVRIPGGEGPARLVRMTSWLDGELLGRGTVSMQARAVFCMSAGAGASETCRPVSKTASAEIVVGTELEH